MPPKLTILYRMCDSVDMLHTVAGEPPPAGHVHSSRFYDVPKPELIGRCAASVADVVRRVTSRVGEGFVVETICVQDRCSDWTLSLFGSLLPDAKIVPSDGEGNGASFGTCVDIASSMADGSTMVLFLEDDYTFLSGDGLGKAVGLLGTISARKGRHCALFLDDYPDRYDPSKGYEASGTDVMCTPYGHAMRIRSSTCSFMTYVDVVREHAEELSAFRRWPEVSERESVDLVWRDVPLYCPIPGITLHCQLRSHIPQYMDADAIRRAIEGR